MNIKAVISLILILSVTIPPPLFTDAQERDAKVSWYDPAWSYRQKIVIDPEQVGSTLTTFPLLVRISDGPIVDNAQPDGDDILFTAEDGITKLLHEVESFNGELVAWVQMPSISDAEDTTFYIYYGNPRAENQQQPTNVWGNKYAAVWHMNNDAVSPQQDATGNGNTGAPENIDSTDQELAGKFAGAVQFDGVNDRIPVSLSVPYTNEMTLSAWFKVTSTKRDQQIILQWGSDTRIQFKVNEQSTDDVRVYFQDYNGGVTQAGPIKYNAGVTDGEWHQAVGTLKNGTARLYIDGLEVATETVNDNFTVNFSPDQNPGISYSNSTQFFSGALDEISVATVARSGDWVKTAYYNQADQENFLSIWAAEKYGASNQEEKKTDDVSSAIKASAPGKDAQKTKVGLNSPLIKAINRLYRIVHAITPTFDEWRYWAGRVVSGDKKTEPSLLGAMQWQKKFSQKLLPLARDVQSQPIPATDGLVVEIRNGTNRQGLAARTRLQLQDKYQISKIGNAANFEYPKTMIYEIKKNDNQAKNLAQQLNAGVGTTLPVGEKPSQANLLIILGYDD